MNNGLEFWSVGPYPPYVAVVLDQPHIGSEWKSWLTNELTSQGIYLDATGAIQILDENGLIRDDVSLGFFRFLERDETEAVLRDAKVKVSALSCPWERAVRGAIGWVHFSQSDVRDLFLSNLLLRTRGPVIRTEDGAAHEFIRQVTFDLSQLVNKNGFGDGDAFLNREPGYMAYAEQVAEKALAEAGLVAAVGATEPRHNPLRIRGDIRRMRDGKIVGESALRGHTMKLWACDYGFLEDASFW